MHRFACYSSNFFRGAMSPNPHIGEGLRRDSPNPITLGTPTLRAFPASLGASIVPQCLLAVEATANTRVVLDD